MRPQRFVCLLTLPLLMIATGSARVSAQATVVASFSIEPFVFDDVHPCTGEPVELAGDLLITERVVTDSNGGQHFSFQLVPSHVRGVGPSGEFKAVGGQREHSFERAGGLPFIGTFTSIFNLVSAGGGDNFVIQETFHVTVNANGEITTVVDNVHSVCRG